jgi:hypothetical protein
MKCNKTIILLPIMFIGTIPLFTSCGNYFNNKNIVQAIETNGTSLSRNLLINSTNNLSIDTSIPENYPDQLCNNLRKISFTADGNSSFEFYSKDKGYGLHPVLTYKINDLEGSYSIAGSTIQIIDHSHFDFVLDDKTLNILKMFGLLGNGIDLSLEFSFNYDANHKTQFGDVISFVVLYS